MPRQAKAEKFKRSLLQYQEPTWSENFMNISYQLLLYIMEIKSQEDQQFCSLNFSDVM